MITLPKGILRPENRDEAVRVFGSPFTQQCRAGRYTLPDPIGRVDHIECNQHVLPAVEMLFKTIVMEKAYDLIRTLGPCYSEEMAAYRFPPIHTPHNWGIALTINHGYNMPMSRPPVPLPENRRKDIAWGPKFDSDHPIVKIAKAQHWTWGGDYPDFWEPAEFIFGPGIDILKV